MALLGLSSLLPRHNGAGAPLVSPSVPVVWLQRKKQGILSHDRPSLRCGARSVMLSHSSRASKMSAYVRSSCCLSCTVRVRGGPVNLSERTAGRASVRPPARVLLRRANTLLDADITPHVACPRMPIANRGCWPRPQQLCRAHGTWQECQSTLDLLTGGFARTHMRMYKDAFSHIKSRALETRPKRPLSGTGLDEAWVMRERPGDVFSLS